MKVNELITKLQTCNPDAQVRIMSSHDDGDDVTDWEITAVHDEWTHDMVSIEFTFDQRPAWTHVAFKRARRIFRPPTPKRGGAGR